MKKNRGFLIRVFSANVSFVYFLSNVAMAHRPETNLWAERRRHTEINRTKNQDTNLLASLPSIPMVPEIGQILSLTHTPNVLSEEVAKTLPDNFVSQHADLFGALSTIHGTIRKVWLPAGGPGQRVVIHIQDVHQNQEAQQHIAGAVDSLLHAHQAGLVALEGAFAPIDVKKYHDFEEREVIKLTADCLLRENLISGPVHAAMTTKATLAPLLGVDDPVHYNANVNAYRASAPKIDALKKDLAARRFNLEKAKTSVFSPALAAFDAKMTAYKEERLSLSDYVVALAPERGVGQTELFLQALSFEKKIDLQKVEKERNELIELLLKNLSNSQIEQLVQQSAGYRMGHVRYGEFYRDLHSLCRSAKIDLPRYPHIDAYIRYVFLAERINAEKLIDELAALQSTRYQTLAITPIEKDLVAQSTTLQLTARLLDFALTPDEWTQYEQRKSKTAGLPDLASFEAFYKEAHARDAAITKNVLRAMDNNQVNTAVLVTGGYHSPGIAERLRHAGVTVISFTPRIEKVDTLHGSTSLSVFTQEKTPLDKLFAGSKLFVSQDPAPLSTIEGTGVAVAGGTAQILSGKLIAYKTVGALLGNRMAFDVTPKENRTAMVTVRNHETNASAQIEVAQGKDGLIRFDNVAPIQPTRPAAWTSSKLLGHSLFFGLIGSVANYFGFDQWMLFAVFVILTWPISVLLPGTRTVTSVWEAWTLRTDLDKWALQHHGVTLRSPEYFSLHLTGRRFLTVWNDHGFWAMVQAHNDFNLKSFLTPYVQLLADKVRTFSNPRAPHSPQGWSIKAAIPIVLFLFLSFFAVQAIAMPINSLDSPFLLSSVVSTLANGIAGTGTLGVIVGGFLNDPASQINENFKSAPPLGKLNDIDLKNETVIQKRVQQSEQHAQAKERAMIQILSLLKTPTVAIILLDQKTLTNQDKLTKVLDAALTRHRKETICFLIGEGQDPSTLEERLKKRTNAQIHIAPGLFGDGIVYFEPVQKHLPEEKTPITVYCPQKYEKNFEGVTNKRLTKESVVSLEGLLQFMERLWRIAELIATQA